LLFTPDLRHLGIACSDTDGSSNQVVHLAWHRDLRNDDLDAHEGWVFVPRIPLARQRQVAALARKVFAVNGQQVPYALSAPSECFNAQTGSLLLGPNRRGLTCATFVLAIFHAAGLPLLQYDTWPPADREDLSFQLWVIAELEKHRADPAHIDGVRSEVGGVRFRSLDCATASISDDIPLPFESVRSMAKAIHTYIRGE
jgi:hypothetical protein